jgi:hypothetical protein
VALKLAELAKLPPWLAQQRGGYTGAIRRVENFVAELSAAGLWRAAGCARMRRKPGSDPPLREFRPSAAINAKIFHHRDTERKPKEKGITQRLQVTKAQRQGNTKLSGHVEHLFEHSVRVWVEVGWKNINDNPLKP